jgi:hypothetical protein
LFRLRCSKVLREKMDDFEISSAMQLRIPKQKFKRTPFSRLCKILQHFECAQKALYVGGENQLVRG